MEVEKAYELLKKPEICEILNGGIRFNAAYKARDGSVEVVIPRISDTEWAEICDLLVIPPKELEGISSGSEKVKKVIDLCTKKKLCSVFLTYLFSEKRFPSVPCNSWDVPSGMHTWFVIVILREINEFLVPDGVKLVANQNGEIVMEEAGRSVAR